ncbi:MAG: HEAT repeat domain-containing protein, partial [Microcystaceae cyanobacterium]
MSQETLSEPINPAYTVEQAIANIQQREDTSARYYAAWWIGYFRVREPIAIQALLEALEDDCDRSPDGGYPLRRNAAKALGKLGDLSVIPALIQALDCEDYYVREAAAIALAELKGEQAIFPLCQLLEGGIEAAQKVIDKPHLTQPYEAILEALGSLNATDKIQLIKPFLEHFSPKVQFAAARALFQLTQESNYAERLITALNGKDLQLRRSAMMDLGATGYLPGASAIARTFAENSLKLIALKNLW